MRDAVEMVVKSLVDDVEAVDVREVDQQGATLIEIRVGPADMGKIIGRQGRTIRALRGLAYVASLKRRHRFVVEIVE
jgi:uncharacterized protein